MDETPEEKAERERLEAEQEKKESGRTDELDLLRETLREVNQARREQETRNNNLEAKINELVKVKEIPRKTPTAEEYFEKPVETMRKEIADQIAPLNEFAAGLKKEKAYFAIKNQFINDAKYGPILQRIGAALDNVILSGTIDVTIDNVRNTINYLVGQVQIEDPEFFSRKPKKETKTEDEENEEIPETPKKKESTLVTPPHMRPSGAPKNSSSREAPKKTYTENERRLMRLNNQTEEEYEAALNSPADLSGVKRKEKK